MSEWESRPIEELVALVSSGGTPRAGDPRYYTEFGTPFLKIDDITKSIGRFVDKAEQSITDLALDESAAKIFPAGTVLVTMYGTMGVTKTLRSPMATNQAIAALVPPFECDPTYLAHALSFRRAGLERLAAQTTQPNISGTIIRRFRLPVPPLEEQQRIAEILDTIDETIQATEHLIEKLKRIRNGLLLEVFNAYSPDTGALPLRASGSAAECVSLSTLMACGEIELGRGKIISSIDIADNPGPYPIYSSSASGTGEFGRYGNYMFDEELITWSVDGGGRPFYRPQHHFSVTNVCGFLRIPATRHWSYRFIHILMEAQHARLTFDWLTKAHPSVIRDLYWLPRIPLSEQHQITKRFTTADTLIRRETAGMVKVRRLRDGLASDLLLGRVRTVAA